MATCPEPPREFGATMEAFGSDASTGVSPVASNPPVDRFGHPMSTAANTAAEKPSLNAQAREWKPPGASMMPSAAVAGGGGGGVAHSVSMNQAASMGVHPLVTGAVPAVMPSTRPMPGAGRPHQGYQQQPQQQRGGRQRGGGMGSQQSSWGSSPTTTSTTRNVFGQQASSGGGIFGSPVTPLSGPTTGSGSGGAGAGQPPPYDNSFQVSSGGDDPKPTPQHTPTGAQQRKPQPQVEYKSSQHLSVEIQKQIQAKQREQREHALQQAQRGEHDFPIPAVMEIPPGPQEGEQTLVLGVPFDLDSVPSYVDRRDWRLRIITERVDTKAKADAECDGKRLKHDFMYGDQMRVPLSADAERELAPYLRDGHVVSGAPAGLDDLKDVVNFFPLDVRPPQHGYPRHMLCLGPAIQQVDTHRAFFAFCGQIPGSVNAAQLLDVVAFLTHSELPPPIAVEKVGDGRCARVYYRTWEEVKVVVQFNHCALIGEYGCWIGTKHAAPALRAWHECRKREVFPKGVGPLSLEFPKDKTTGAPLPGHPGYVPRPKPHQQQQHQQF
uniref:Uncharacterized protein n=1 Tax=Neobodo designis TaxID=312471 RepID=A0A7S1LMA1_NEODS|mmetsp:Transcript_2485/g.7712  ORF Transcript_2485/g.7712 Transcript_2485/m.7712 type:complete len:551 (+) Transcript_2485:505-2157(+)